MLTFFILFNLIILCPIVLYGIIIAFINKLCTKNLTAPSKWWIYTIFGFIGTPIHELSHLIFNLLFFHRITGVALYRPIKGKKDGTLGYVNFTYKTDSLYQNIGLFFTGIAPMIGGCAVLFLLMKFLLPDISNSIEYVNFNSLNIIDILLQLKNSMVTNFNNLINYSGNIMNLIIFLILAFAISTHMHISVADLKNAVTGWFVLEIILLIISVLLGVYNLTGIAGILFIISSYIFSFLTIGLIFSIISLIISYIIALF